MGFEAVGFTGAHVVGGVGFAKAGLHHHAQLLRCMVVFCSCPQIHVWFAVQGPMLIGGSLPEHKDGRQDT